MRSAGQQRAERDDPLHSTALGHTEERVRVGAPFLMRFRAREQEEAVAAIPGLPRKELAPRPGDVAVPIGPQSHLGPLLGEHEELFRLGSLTGSFKILDKTGREVRVGR
jgi:hypothetical protein